MDQVGEPTRRNKTASSDEMELDNEYGASSEDSQLKNDSSVIKSHKSSEAFVEDASYQPVAEKAPLEKNNNEQIEQSKGNDCLLQLKNQVDMLKRQNVYQMQMIQYLHLQFNYLAASQHRQQSSMFGPDTMQPQQTMNGFNQMAYQQLLNNGTLPTDAAQNVPVPASAFNSTGRSGNVRFSHQSVPFGEQSNESGMSSTVAGNERFQGNLPIFSGGSPQIREHRSEEKAKEAFASASLLNPFTRALQQQQLQQHKAQQQAQFGFESSVLGSNCSIPERVSALLAQSLTKDGLGHHPDMMNHAASRSPVTSIHRTNSSSHVDIRQPPSMLATTATSNKLKSQPIASNVAEEKPLKKNQCKICDRVLSCPSALKLHYRTHTGTRICPWSFSVLF